MHKSNRVELNTRFEEVYNLLKSKGEIIKNDRQKSKMAFAEKLGTKGHIVDLYLKGKRKITYEQVKKLCSFYEVNEEYMFQGKGTPFSDSNKNGENSEPEKLQNALGINFSTNVLFTNIEAFASNTVSANLWEENHTFQIPGMYGDLVAFNINGNSMAPTILNGDTVICQPLSNNDEILEGEIYAVVSDQSVWVKRVKRDFSKSHSWTHFKLISDNFEEFPPFSIEKNEVRKILKVKRRLTGVF